MCGYMGVFLCGAPLLWNAIGRASFHNSGEIVVLVDVGAPQDAVAPAKCMGVYVCVWVYGCIFVWCVGMCAYGFICARVWVPECMVVWIKVRACIDEWVRTCMGVCMGLFLRVWGCVGACVYGCNE